MAGATAENFYSLLASAVGAATSSSPSAIPSEAIRDLSNSGTLIPPTVQGDDRLTFIAAQRERLSILLSALDKEARNLQGTSTKSPAPRNMSLFFDGNTSNSEEEATDRPKSAMSGLSTRKSEVDFEKIDAESGSEEVENGRRQTVKRGQSASGSWLPWSWGAKAESSDASVDTIMASVGEDKGKSSAVDA